METFSQPFADLGTEMSGDFGMEQYVSWILPSEELTLNIIWEKFEEFC